MKKKSILSKVAMVSASLCAGFILANAQAASFIFSLDMGSDKEISDPTGGGLGEGLDPGDLYKSRFVAGSTGMPWLDDVNIFGGTDPFPQQGIPTSRCVAGSGIFVECFDMDGTDNLDFYVSELSFQNGPVFQQSIGNTACVRNARFLAVSIDDDGAEGMEQVTGLRAPTEDGPEHGSSASFDEILGVTRTGGSVTVAAIADEKAVHVDLSPNPLPQIEDDDVDALDIAYRQPCDVNYFSADDEAHLAAAPLPALTPLNPGSIYEVDSMVVSSPVEVINHADLGISMHADIDAFEFAWLRVTGTTDNALALLFSVDEDRPSTIEDESGGLDPGAIYSSFMNQSSTVLISSDALLGDDIDAIAVSRRDLTVDSDGDNVFDGLDNCISVFNPGQVDADEDGHGNVCDGDFNNDCSTNFIDLSILADGFLGQDPVLDLDNDGAVNFIDFGIFSSLFLLPAGASADGICN